MLYISPIRFFEQLNISTEDLSDVKNLKKIVNLEFLSSETGIIPIDGFDYNKQDLLQLLSDEHFERHWDFHRKIWDNKFLLDVLEREAVDMKQLREVLAFKNDAAFCQFISPYFATPFNNITKVLLNNQFARDLYLWLQTKVYLGQDDEEVAYASLRIYLDEALYLFRNINSTNYEDKLAEIGRWETPEWANVLNSLPDYLFHYRDAVAEGLTHVLVVMQRNQRRMCYEISSWLVKLNISSPHLVETIKKNHYIFKNNKGTSSSFKFSQNRWIYFVIIVIVRVCISAGSCNHSSTTNSYQDMMDATTPIKQPLVNTISDNTENKKTDKEKVYANLNYQEIAQLFYNTYIGDPIESSGGLNQKQYGKLPIYISFFESEQQFLQPFRIQNNTGADLVLVYFQGSTTQAIDFPNKTYFYCDPNENQSVDFLLDSITVLKESYWEKTQAAFPLNGAQSIAFSVHKQGEVKQVDNTNLPYLTRTDSLHKGFNLTLSVTQKAGKYIFSTKGDKVYYLTKK